MLPVRNVRERVKSTAYNLYRKASGYRIKLRSLKTPKGKSTLARGPLITRFEAV
jgi:hypothetical protein